MLTQGHSDSCERQGKIQRAAEKQLQKHQLNGFGEVMEIDFLIPKIFWQKICWGHMREFTSSVKQLVLTKDPADQRKKHFKELLSTTQSLVKQYLSL